MRLRSIVILLTCVASTSARAERELNTRGYLLSRSQLVPRHGDALLYPMLEVEKFQGFIEGNLDLTLKDDRYTFRSDTSGLFRISPEACRADSDVPACLVINELYLSVDAIDDRLVVIAGRHRPSWGAALSYHPVEPMNPQPDPTDPAFQRLGAWTVMAELSSDRHVATAGWFPSVSHSALGTPSGLEPGLIGSRYSFRPENLDLSALYFHDLETGLPMAGVAGSAVLGSTPFEVHGEALVHQRREIKTGTLKEGTCPLRSLGIPHREEWDFSGIFGGRWDRGDGTLVNLEYMHNGDGMVRNDFNAVLETADLLSDMCPEARLEPSDASEDGRPQQLSTTLLRRNYLILSALKPTFGEEGPLSKLGVTGALLFGLDDRSGVFSGRLVYAMTDSTMLRFGGLAVFGGDRTQYGILPFRSMIIFDIETLL
jgi:hypothetical protein